MAIVVDRYEPAGMTLVSRHGKPGQAVVAKLDVEGAEAAALEGMGRTHWSEDDRRREACEG